MRALALTLALVLSTSILAQSVTEKSAPPPVDLPPTTRLNLLTPRIAIHAADDPEPSGLTPIQRAIQSRDRIANNFLAVELEIVINENGRVESAKPTAGPKRFYDQAVQVEMHRAFAPVRIDGEIVRASTQDSVSIYPPERWVSPRTPFPADPDLRSITMGLTRTGCLGNCPSYTVTIHGDGQVVFESEDPSSAAPGVHVGHISPESLRNLIDQFRHADFLSAEDDYTCAWTDMPSQTLTLAIAGHQKKVFDYGGEIVGMPESIGALEKTIDESVDISRWTTGNADTVPSLVGEHWNFASPSTANLQLFDSAINHGNEDLLHHLLMAHAPISTDNPSLISPVCVASRVGNKSLVQQMLKSQLPAAKLRPSTLSECLGQAALGGSLPVVDLWLGLGARPQPVTAPKPEDGDFYKHRSAVLNAIDSGNSEVLARLLQFHPDLTPAANDDRSLLTLALQRAPSDNPAPSLKIISLLLEAGADVNAETDQDDPPLFHITGIPQAVQLLVRAGADPNGRNDRTQTPLMNNDYSSDAIEALLQAGADPTLKDRDGKTALDDARTTGCKVCVTLIEAAIAAKLQLPKAP